MPYPDDPYAPAAPAPARQPGMDWRQLLTAIGPMVAAGFAGQGTGMGAFGQNYARGAALAEELRQREQAMRTQERLANERLAMQRQQEQRAQQDAEMRRQLQSLKMFEMVDPMIESALADAEGAGLMFPPQQAEYASKAVRDALSRYSRIAPSIGISPEDLLAAAGDISAKASTRMLKKLHPLYAKMTDEATQEQVDAFRRDPTPRIGGLPFAEFEKLLPDPLRWVPKTTAPSKVTTLEGLLAQAVQKGDEQEAARIRRQMGLQAAATRKPETATGDEPTGFEGVGEGLLAQLPKDEAQLVKAIADYQLDVTKVASQRKPANAESERKRLIKLVMQYDPTFDMNLYRQVADTRREFTVGKGAQNVRSLNTAIGHIGDLAQKAKALETGSMKLWNRAKQIGLTQTGDPRVTNFLTAANAVEGELATLFKGTGATDQEIKAWREVIDAAGSPEQLQGFIKTAIELAFSRLGALKDQYVKGVRKSDRQFLNDKSRKVLDGLGIDWTEWDDTLPTGGVETPEPGAPARKGLGPNPYRGPGR